LQQVVKRIRALESTEARVSAALEFVQSEIRYFSVSLGESSHRPAPPDIVFRRRYGDCKDKSFLLITLLGEMGIQSSPVLLQSGRRTGLEKTLPSSQFFDHAIVQVLVDGKTYFLDPTRLGQHGLLDRLGQAHEGVQVLVVAPATRDLSTISTNNIADLTFEEAQEHATLAKFDDDAELQTKRVWNGVTAEYLRIASESSREPFLRWIGNALERRYPGAKLSNEPTISDDRIRNTFSITANYKVPKLAADRNGNWIVYLRPDIFENVVLASSAAARKTPLRVAAYPYKGKYTFDMAFPEEVSVISDPHTENVANKYFIANSSTYFRGNNAKVTADIETLASHVDPADYQKYAEDLQTANRVLGAVLYVNRLGIKSKEVSAKTDLRQRLRDARQEAIDKITETIKSGKLAGTDLAETYCARGGAFSDLQRHDEALQDANEAIRLAPNSANVFACRAFFYFNAGLFDKSVADYSKAVSFGATDFEVFRMRGMARLYAGRLEDAQSDLQKATGTKDKENKIYFDLWLVTTTARLGQPVPEELLKRASMEAHGDWPRPALAMLTGAISPDDLLKRMDEKKGDERDMALAEGYFYLGQHYLNVGDKQTARTYFQKVRELEIIIYLEHVAAGFELQRLMDVNSAAQQPTNKRAVAQ
jgi:lipoprotein NlpI